MRWLASVAFLTIGLRNGLGAVGHSFPGRLAVDAELAKFPVASNVRALLYAVWRFSGLTATRQLGGGVLRSN